MARSNMTAYRNELKLGETLTQEFKSDIARLNDRELVAAVVALANTEGGLLWLGVEDDGQVTGLHRQHLDLSGMAAMIANRTTPPISVAITGVHFNSAGLKRMERRKQYRFIHTSFHSANHFWGRWIPPASL